MKDFNNLNKRHSTKHHGTKEFYGIWLSPEQRLARIFPNRNYLQGGRDWGEMTEGYGNYGYVFREPYSHGEKTVAGVGFMLSYVEVVRESH